MSFRRRYRGHAARRRFARLATERLEDRLLLAQVGYQVHLLPPDGNLGGSELTSVDVGQSYDLVVSVKDMRDNPGPNAGVFAGYVDIGYDSSKTQVQVGEVQRIRIGPFSAANPASSASGSFTLVSNGHVSWPISFSGDVNALAADTQKAVGALSGVGLGNVSVTADILNNATSEVVLQVRFLNEFFHQNVQNLTIGSQHLSGPTNPQVSMTYDGDLASGADFAFTEAFRSRLGTPAFVNGLSAGNQPNLLDDVGAFAAFTPTGTGLTELVRARMVATAAGSVTFTPDIANRALPEHNTLLFDPITPVPDSEIDLGTPKTLTITTAPIVAVPDFYVAVTNAFFPVVIDVLANDVTTPAGQSKTIVSVDQPPLGTTSIHLNRIHYIPAPGFTGTETFTYTAQNTAAGGAASTGIVTVSVVSPTEPLMRYQVRLVRPDAPLYERDPQNAKALVSTPDLTTLNLGDEYDVVITVQPTSMTPLGVFAAYTDITFDPSKTAITADNVQDAFRPVGRPTIAGVNDTTTFFNSGYFAGSAPGRIDDVGAFTTLASTSALTPAEAAAGYAVAPPRELTRARFKATAVGDVTFAADLSQIQNPTHASHVFGITGTLTGAMLSAGTPKSISIAAVAPYAAAADSASLLEDSPGVAIDVLANDTFPAPSTSKEIVSFTQPASGVVTQEGQSLRYVPAADFFGTVTFTYTAKGNAMADSQLYGTATVTVTVEPVNDVPTLDPIAGPITLLEDPPPTTITLTGISAGAGESQIVSGTTALNGGLIATQSLEFFPETNSAKFSFELKPNVSGTQIVIVRIADDGGTAHGGVDFVERTLTITVDPVNDAPSFTIGGDQTAADESGPQTIANWATDVSAGPGENDQSLAFTVVAADTSLFAVQPAINASGTLTYTPALNASGTTEVTVQLADNGPTTNGGVNQSAQLTFFITIEKLHLMHNAALPLDTTGDSSITATDALRCINFLNAFSAGPVSADPEPDNRFLDVNADGFITAGDPLAIINHINAFGPLISGEGGGEGGEGESSGAASDLYALLALDAAVATTRKRK